MKRLLVAFFVLAFVYYKASAQHFFGVEIAHTNSFPHILNLNRVPQNITSMDMRLVYEYKKWKDLSMSFSLNINHPNKAVGYESSELSSSYIETHEIAKSNTSISLNPSICFFPIPNYLFLRIGGSFAYAKIPEINTISRYSYTDFANNRVVTLTTRNLSANWAFQKGFVFGSGVQFMLSEKLKCNIEAQFLLSYMNANAKITSKSNAGAPTIEQSKLIINQTVFSPSIGFLYSLNAKKNQLTGSNN